MSGNDLSRVRADLSNMRNALGLGLPWSEIDVWFGAAISAAAGLFAVLSWPNAPWLVSPSWAAAPMEAAIGAYLVYIAFKSRRLPPREEPRRREYKSGLLALAVVLPAAMVYGKWGTYAGMTQTQLGGSVLALMGMTFLVIGIVHPPARYPRSYFIVGALPLITFGLAIPLVQPPYYYSLMGLLGQVELGVAAFIAHGHIRRQATESSNDVSN